MRPDLHIVARTYDREHVYQLFQAGANDIARELFDSSLRVGRYELENISLSQFEASEIEMASISRTAPSSASWRSCGSPACRCRRTPNT